MQVPQVAGGPHLRTIAMPRDTNASGAIFGGWTLSQMDLAGGTFAAQHAKRRPDRRPDPLEPQDKPRHRALAAQHGGGWRYGGRRHPNQSGTVSPAHSDSNGWRARITDQRPPSTSTSAASGRPVPAQLVACGEIGLGGEVRSVTSLERRLSEAARLGFTRAVVPASAPDPPAGIAAVRVRSLSEAIAAVGLLG